MPYKDSEKQHDYQRKWIREYRKRQKAKFQQLKIENKWLKKAIVALSEAQK